MCCTLKMNKKTIVVNLMFYTFGVKVNLGNASLSPSNITAIFPKELEMQLQVKKISIVHMFNSQSTNCKSLKDKTNCEESASYNRHSHYKPQQNKRMLAMLGAKIR